MRNVDVVYKRIKDHTDQMKDQPETKSFSTSANCLLLTLNAHILPVAYDSPIKHNTCFLF